MRTILRMTACLAVLLLSACAAMPSKQEVMADPDAYMANHFTGANIDPELRFKLKIGPTAQLKKNLQIKTVMTVDSGEKDKSVFDRSIKFKVFDNGLVQRKTETGKNGFVSVTHFELDYGYVVDLKYHEIFHEAAYTQPSRAVNSIARLDKGFLNPAENSKYVTDIEIGTPIQIANFVRVYYSCNTGAKFDAKTISDKLTGQALYFDCEHFSNNVVFYKSKHLALLDYGVSVPVEESSAKRKRTWSITDVL